MPCPVRATTTGNRLLGESLRPSILTRPDESRRARPRALEYLGAHRPTQQQVCCRYGEFPQLRRAHDAATERSLLADPQVSGVAAVMDRCRRARETETNADEAWRPWPSPSRQAHTTEARTSARRSCQELRSGRSSRQPSSRPDTDHPEAHNVVSTRCEDCVRRRTTRLLAVIRRYHSSLTISAAPPQRLSSVDFTERTVCPTRRPNTYSCAASLRKDGRPTPPSATFA